MRSTLVPSASLRVRALDDTQHKHSHNCQLSPVDEVIGKETFRRCCNQESLKAPLIIFPAFDLVANFLGYNPAVRGILPVCSTPHRAPPIPKQWPRLLLASKWFKLIPYGLKSQRRLAFDLPSRIGSAGKNVCISSILLHFLCLSCQLILMCPCLTTMKVQNSV